MTALLTFLSCLAALALLGIVAVYLILIRGQLDAIGGTPSSYLAKIRFGLRAIETETGHLRPEVTQLNEAEVIMVERRNEHGELKSIVDIRPFLENVEIVDDRLVIQTCFVSGQSASAKDVLTALALPWEQLRHKVRRKKVEWN